MKKLILLFNFIVIMSFFSSSCDLDNYCYRENIYIFDAENQQILLCKEGEWVVETQADLKFGCNFVCSDEESEKANHDWCQKACLNYINSSDN